MSNIAITFAVQYNADPSDQYGWEDTRHGDRFESIEAAERYRDDWDLPSSVRIVRRTEEVVEGSERRGDDGTLDFDAISQR